MSSHGMSQEHALLAAVLERLVSITKSSVWPEFPPATMPLAIAITDAESTWRTSPLPEGVVVAKSSVQVPESQTMSRFAGIDPRIVANSVADFDGVPTATVIVPAEALAAGAGPGDQGRHQRNRGEAPAAEFDVRCI